MEPFNIDDSAFLNGIAKYARYNNTIQQILLLLDVDEMYHAEVIREFEDPTSQVYRFYEMGKLKAEHDIIDGLENMIDSGADGAGDAARAIHYMKKQTGHTDLKRELFGL